jgi:hypothetical protein
MVYNLLCSINSNSVSQEIFSYGIQSFIIVILVWVSPIEFSTSQPIFLKPILILFFHSWQCCQSRLFLQGFTAKISNAISSQLPLSGYLMFTVPIGHPSYTIYPHQNLAHKSTSFLQNIGNHLPNYIVSWSRRPQFSLLRFLSIYISGFHSSF